MTASKLRKQLEPYGDKEVIVDARGSVGKSLIDNNRIWIEGTVDEIAEIDGQPVLVVEDR